MRGISNLLDGLGLPVSASEALSLALGLFEGDELATINWLQTPALALGHQKPADLLKTESGRQQVIEFIWKIENGVSI